MRHRIFACFFHEAAVTVHVAASSLSTLQIGGIMLSVYVASNFTGSSGGGCVGVDYNTSSKLVPTSSSVLPVNQDLPRSSSIWSVN